MKLTLEERRKINLLSDKELYETAISFANRHEPPTKAQLSGLENITRLHKLGEIIDFAERKTRRDTLADDLKIFYQDLSSYLGSLSLKVKKEYKLVVIPEDVTRRQKSQLNEKAGEYAYFLAKEFIQHLVSEISYQRSL